MRRQKQRKRHASVPKERRSPVIKILVVAAIVTVAAITVVSRQAMTKQANVALASPISPTSPTSTPADASGKKYVTVKVGGRDVQVDSQTGQIKPLTPDEAKQLAEGLKKMLNKSTEGLVEVQHPDGSVSMDLQDRFQNVAVARVNDDGSVTQSCIDEPGAAAEFFNIDPKLLGVEGAKTKAPVRTSPAKSQIK